MNQLTVNDLLSLCADAKKNGYGDKQIIISNDVEGNGYHGLWYGLTTDPADIKMIVDGIYISDSNTDNPEDLVILG